MDRQVEFCNWYKDRLISCLIKDRLSIELIFCIIGVDLVLRQREIGMLIWEQIDLKNKIIKDVKISKKLSPDQIGLLSYGDMKMTDDIVFILENYITLNGVGKGKLFPINNKGVYYDSIRKSIGDITFSGMRLRQIGITLKAAEVEDWRKR